MTSLINKQNGYCEKSLLQLGPYRTGPVYCEKYRDRLCSKHYCGHHPGGEWNLNLLDASLYNLSNIGNASYSVKGHRLLKLLL
jgi:hypothetical protein